MADYDYIKKTLVALNDETNIDLKELENLLADYISNGFEEYVNNSLE